MADCAWKQALSYSRGSRHGITGCIDPDLLNPLRVESPAENVLIAQAAINDFNRRVNERHVVGMLTPDESEALSKLLPSRCETSVEGRVRRMPTRAASKESLLDAFSRLGTDHDLAPLKWSSCASGGRHERRGQGVFPAFIAALGTRRAHMLAFFKP